MFMSPDKFWDDKAKMSITMNAYTKHLVPESNHHNRVVVLKSQRLRYKVLICGIA